MSSETSETNTYSILLDARATQNKMRSRKRDIFHDSEREKVLRNFVFWLSYNSNGDKAKESRIKDSALDLQLKFNNPLGEEIFEKIFKEALEEGDREKKRENKQIENAKQKTQDAMAIIADSSKAKNDVPYYIYDVTNKDGDPTGEIAIDYKKYSEFLSKHFNIVNFKNTIYIYDEKMFIHRQQINEIRTHARDTYIKYKVSGLLQSVVREVDTHIQSMGSYPEYPFVGALGQLNMKNGILDVNTGELKEHDPKILFDYVISTEYKIYDTTPDLDSFLSNYGNTEIIQVLAKCLWQRAYMDTLKEFTVFFGERDCGKTTAAELIQSTIDGDLHSKRNTSRTILNDMLQRFGYSGMENKLINIGDDLPDMFIKNTGRINELVGSVHHNIEKKGIDHYHGIITAYHLFTTNSLPPLDDDDATIWSKIRLSEFTKTFQRGSVREILYTDTLKEQLLYKAVQLLMSWKNEPYKNNQTVDEVRTIWHEASSDVELFIADKVQFDTCGFMKLNDVKIAYENWCHTNKKRRHIKYLTKHLQVYLARRPEGNGYMISIIPDKQRCNPEQSSQERLDADYDALDTYKGD